MSNTQLSLSSSHVLVAWPLFVMTDLIRQITVEDSKKSEEPEPPTAKRATMMRVSENII